MIQLENYNLENLFSIEDMKIKKFLATHNYPWEALSHINQFVMDYIQTLQDEDSYLQMDENVWVHRTVKLSPTAVLNGPCIIGEGSEVRPGAYIRGNVFIGKNCVIGNSCEFKNVILMNHVDIPHFSYVGDSILGNYVHFGAGVITSNFRQDHQAVKIRFPDGEILQTQLRKFGAIIGDGCEIGCNSVLNPGTILGKRVQVYPLTSLRSVVDANSIVKNSTEIIKII